MEIKAARYFEGFQAKSQKEQLEFVNDSRKQIEELVGEVKIALTQQGEALPEQIRTLIEHQIEELSSEQLFDRLSGLKGLLSSIAFLGVDSKSISEFVDRNQPYIAEYLERLMNVEVSVITKTLEGRQEIEDKVRSGELSLTQGMLETPMFKPFQNTIGFWWIASIRSPRMRRKAFSPRTSHLETMRYKIQVNG